MPTARILLAEDEPITRMDLAEMLTETGYEVVGEASDGWEAVQMASQLRPTVVLMDIKMPQVDGLVAAQKIVDRGWGTVILLSAYSQKDLVEKGKKAGVAAYLVKPVREAELLPAIEIAVARQRHIEQLEQEVLAARAEVESRKLIERAKGTLMRLHGLSEEAAYRQIQRISMSRRQTLAEVSRRILEQ